MQATNGADRAAKTRHAPASYPAASLSLCLKKAKLALESNDKFGKKAWVPQEEFAVACGYKGFVGNSAPKGLIAALSHFGLIERDNKKSIRFSQELIDGLNGTEAQRANVALKAFKRPKVHQALMGAFGQAPSPSRKDVAGHLQSSCGFAPRPAQIMASNFIEDLALVRSLDNGTQSNQPKEPQGAAGLTEKITAPSGAQLTMSMSKPLEERDYAFLEGFFRLKGQTEGSKDSKGKDKAASS